MKLGSHIHLMGICGTAMASLAGLLKDRGFKITGSDNNPYPPMSTQLEKLGIPILSGYKAENLTPAPDFVIVGNVISRTHEEAQALLKTEIPYTSLPKALGEWVIEDRQSVVIAGTHGKTTTTSMMSWIAEACGHQPGFLIGGIPHNFSHSFRNPKGNFFVIEGDEYDTAFFDKVPKFIHYRPRHVILTSIEFDHADIYKDLDHVKSAFEQLVNLIPTTGTLMACGDEPNVLEQAAKAKCPVKTYGWSPKQDYQARVISGSKFEVYNQSKLLGTFELQIPGDYNILNATAAIGLAHKLGWPMDKVNEAIASFKGVKRRQEILGEPNGILVIEDFAHHPTAVRKTIEAIQNKYQGRKVWSVFEPRSATSRRKIFQEEYVESFKVAHRVILAKAFNQANIPEDNRFSSEEVVERLKALSHPAWVLDTAIDITRFLIENAQPGDVILIMSNGGFDGIYEKLLQGLKS